MSANARSAVAPVEDVGRVPDRESARGGGFHVDVIDADPEVADKFHAGEAVHHRGIHGRVPVGVDRFDVPGVIPRHEFDAPCDEVDNDRGHR